MAYQPRVVTPYMPNMLVDVLLRFALPVLLIVVGRVLVRVLSSTHVHADLILLVSDLQPPTGCFVNLSVSHLTRISSKCEEGYQLYVIPYHSQTWNLDISFLINLVLK